MAVWEARRQVTAAKWGNVISQISWIDWTSQDKYYWLENSFQYSSNINTDNELHGIKLSTKAYSTSSYGKCHLVSLWEHWVMALPVDTKDRDDDVVIKRFQYNWSTAQTQWEELDSEAGTTYSYKYQSIAWVVFQDRYWFGSNRTQAEQDWTYKWYLTSLPLDYTNDHHWVTDQQIYLPYDHVDYTDESIETPANDTPYMKWGITAILNYNNTRLVVACGQDIWVYYPELDDWDKHGTDYLWQTWWKRVLHYEAWVTVVALTCTFEYLKVWAVDEWWNTKVYYYQGNNNLRSTFVYNLVDLTWVHVLKVYSINWVDYYTSSIWEYAEDTMIDFNKLVWTTPVKLFTQRAWMTDFDINDKSQYFIGPTSMSWAYNDWHIYVADALWIFSFRYSPNSVDKWYMKWRLRDHVVNKKQVYWLCENKGYLYVSDSDGCRAVRLYDTWIDWYQNPWVLISREFEGKEWGTITKMLDEIRLNFELNPLTNYNWNIDVYVSPNNLWKNTTPVWTWLPADMSDYASNDYDWWFHVMHITQDSIWTRTEKSNLLNNLHDWESAFKFDWQTITYAIVISQPEGSEPKATPIVRQVDIRYHCKDKTNNVYDIN